MGNPTARAGRAAALLTLIVLLVAPGIVYAQSSTLDVTGTVKAADGTPIAGASVNLTSQAGADRARTDARGFFVMHEVRSGTYALHVSAPGYQTLSERTVTVGANDATLTVTLSPATTNALTVIGRVSASSGETVSTASAPTDSLSAQAAAAAGTTSVGAMVWSALSTTPVIPLGGGSTATVDLAVRGPDPTETIVDIDGHPMNNGNTGDFDLSLLDPAALQEVEIVYGIAPSSLIGPNQIGGGVNITTLQPTIEPHALLRLFGGSYGSFGGTFQTTGTADRFGYAVSLHDTSSLGSVNQTILAPPAPVSPPTRHEILQDVGSNSDGDSLITKLRYQLGGPTGYGYLQLNFRNQNVTKDESALLTNYTPPGFGGDVDDARVFDLPDLGGYQSFAGTTLGAHQSNYGFDAQLPLGSQQVDGAPSTIFQFSHLTTLNSQSVDGPGAATLPYLYNQRDLLGDDWIELDHHFTNGLLSFKYDIGTESLTTDYVQSQVVAEAQPFDRTPPTQVIPIAQTQRYAVLRYNGDPTSQIHYSIAAYQSDFSTFGSSFDPRAGFVWTPTGNTAVRASVGTTFQTPQLSELVVPAPNERVPVGGVIYIGNPNLRPDQATDFDLGAEQIFGKRPHSLHVSGDLYQTNLRSPSNQLNVIPVPGCQSMHNPAPCPISYPVNAGNGTYRGLDVHADQELGANFHIRAGWDVDSSFLTVIPPYIQDGTLAAGEQSLGQPLHKAYVSVGQEPLDGLGYGAQLNYEGWYNELNRGPYATLNAHLIYRHDGFQYGVYGTNLTNAYSQPFTIIGGGMTYGGAPGQPVIPTDAYILQGATVTFVITRSI